MSKIVVQKPEFPSFQNICLVVKWSFLYAKENLDIDHPFWPLLHENCQWFRAMLCFEMKIDLSTDWEDLCKECGVLPRNEYSSLDIFWDHWNFGRSNFLPLDDARERLEQLQEIKSGKFPSFS